MLLLLLLLFLPQWQWQRCLQNKTAAGARQWTTFTALATRSRWWLGDHPF
jgi:hypothetical protein